VVRNDGDLPAIAPVGAAHGLSIEADDHALERAMRLHRLSSELQPVLAAERGAPREPTAP
jgi:hypothetical protein